MVPSRAALLSGTGTTLVVRVELRKGDVLYINDGSFGNMFEVCSMQWKNAVQLIRPLRRGAGPPAKTLVPFRFYGPTCDLWIICRVLSNCPRMCAKATGSRS